MADARRPSLFDAITAAATRPGGREDAQDTLDELTRLRDTLERGAKKQNRRRGSLEPRLNYEAGLRDRVTDAHVKTMASMIYSLSFAPLTVHTQIWCAWWWWPEEIAKLLEDVRFYG